MNDHIVLLKSLADPTRLKLLKLTLQEELCVCEFKDSYNVLPAPPTCTDISNGQCAKAREDQPIGDGLGLGLGASGGGGRT
jgi:DNA-binding transcriptional ArsR family regulator